MADHFGNISVDIKNLHEQINKLDQKSSRVKTLNLLARFTYLALIRLGLFKKLVDSGFIRGWFKEFNQYWMQQLDGRPLNLHDFFFLYSWYRTKFQSIEVSENADENEFMASWQKRENIYLTFHSAYKIATAPFSYYPFKKYLPSNGAILEYGCGMAPIVTSLVYSEQTNYSLTIADIPQFTFHYAKWKLKNFGVKCVDIDPSELPELKDNYDTIFLQAVLEHLPNPLDVVKNLTAHLKKGGYLIFDYSLGDGHGLDTMESVRQRKDVLDYLSDTFELTSGKFEAEKSMGTTIIRKK